jgi:hypothetical protein
MLNIVTNSELNADSVEPDPLAYSVSPGYWCRTTNYGHDFRIRIKYDVTYFSSGTRDIHVWAKWYENDYPLVDDCFGCGIFGNPSAPTVVDNNYYPSVSASWTGTNFTFYIGPNGLNTSYSTAGTFLWADMDITGGEPEGGDQEWYIKIHIDDDGYDEYYKWNGAFGNTDFELPEVCQSTTTSSTTSTTSSTTSTTSSTTSTTSSTTSTTSSTTTSIPSTTSTTSTTTSSTTTSIPSGTSTTSSTTTSIPSGTSTTSSTTTSMIGDDHGNSIGTATLISLNNSTNGSIDSAGDYDYFRFNLTNRSSVTIYTTGTTDTYGYLLDSSGTEIRRNDDDIDRNFQIIETLNAGTYYIAVRNYYSSATSGNYVLSTSTATAPTTSTSTTSISNDVEPPLLISPEDGIEGLAQTVEFMWEARKGYTNRLFVCTNQNFEGCESTVIASNQNSIVIFAGFSGILGFLLFFGVLSNLVLRKRRNLFILLIAFSMLGVAISCNKSESGGGNDKSNESNEMVTHSTTEYLEGARTYYWKVEVEDVYGVTAESDIRTFTVR